MTRPTDRRARKVYLPPPPKPILQRLLEWLTGGERMSAAPAWLDSIESKRSSVTSKAWAFAIDGVPHLVKTDGNVILALRGVDGGEVPDVSVRTTLSDFFKSYPLPHRTQAAEVALADLRAFVVLPDEACATCGGSGNGTCAKCLGGGEVECECSCGDEHEATCDECNGSGKSDCRACTGVAAIQPVRIGTQVFDARLWRKFIGHIDGASAMFVNGITQGSPPKPAALFGAWGFAYVMSLREDGSTPADIPTFALAAVGAA